MGPESRGTLREIKLIGSLPFSLPCLGEQAWSQLTGIARRCWAHPHSHLSCVIGEWLPWPLEKNQCFRVLSVKQKLHLIGRLYWRKQSVRKTTLNVQVWRLLFCTLTFVGTILCQVKVSKPGVFREWQCLFFSLFSVLLSLSPTVMFLLHHFSCRAEHSWVLLIYSFWNKDG